VAQLGGPDVPRPKTLDRFERGIDVLDLAIEKADSPEELLARTAEGLYVAADLNPRVLLQGTLPAGWFREHNGQSMVDKAKSGLQRWAPSVWLHYSRLSEAEKQQLNIL
jgi:hypothetical protein